MVQNVAFPLDSHFRPNRAISGGNLAWTSSLVYSPLFPTPTWLWQSFLAPACFQGAQFHSGGSGAYWASPWKSSSSCAGRGMRLRAAHRAQPSPQPEWVRTHHQVRPDSQVPVHLCASAPCSCTIPCWGNGTKKRQMWLKDKKRHQ